MHFWVYLLRCADQSYYAGHTDDLGRRLAEHQAGLGADWTMRRRPVTLAWCEYLPSRDEAFAFERRLKGWTRAKKEALIERDWDRVHELARSTEKLATLARPERSAKRAVEGRSTLTYEERPSTTLRSAQDEQGGGTP
ncbi:GIY-YIG nuclease family protein [Sphingomonas sp. BN140010]|uniref:GIY-YIG nuclease family protein n=1 Tax=Sphingomonas arvum TaxID=2992113 RepID=A0ABT3JD13_9SPHN|nr:GIY-YIG nuclease family protein [Sphingomonas sp. BN140010]MCW3796947.1 GIY-YIG nuclease family protein [Sphingomonas sp. BN140010]